MQVFSDSCCISAASYLYLVGLYTHSPHSLHHTLMHFHPHPLPGGAQQGKGRGFYLNRPVLFSCHISLSRVIETFIIRL